MNEYCEVCGQDPCVCNDGFSIKEGEGASDDLLLDDDALGAEDTLLAETLSQPDPLLDEYEAKPEDALYDDEDASIDIPYTDEEESF